LVLVSEMRWDRELEQMKVAVWGGRLAQLWDSQWDSEMDTVRVEA
jgi:hypothetical protein